jgi:phosphopantetheine--protein transferase-like protein
MSSENCICLLAFMHAGEISGDVDTLIFSLPFGESERERLLATKNPAAQKNSLSALLCLDRLSKRMELGGKDLTIIREKNGKPRFATLPYHFSITHSRDLCAVALSSENVGLDLEFVDASHNVEALSKRFFSADEYSKLTQSKNSTEDFFALWTKKEALAKLSGEGLASICHGQIIDGSQYSFKEYKLTVDGGVARLALCFEGDAPSIDINDTRKEIKIYEIQN